MQILTVYLKSGQILKLKCESANFTYSNDNGEYLSYTVTGATQKFSINPREIAAWTAKEALF